MFYLPEKNPIFVLKSPSPIQAHSLSRDFSTWELQRSTDSNTHFVKICLEQETGIIMDDMINQFQQLMEKGHFFLQNPLHISLFLEKFVKIFTLIWLILQLTSPSRSPSRLLSVSSP